MSDQFTIRLATLDGVEAIAEHCTRMFKEMGEVPPAVLRRSLYRRLGFVDTNEMRLTGE